MNETKEMNIEDFIKIDFRIGEIEEVSKSEFKIRCNDRIFNTKTKLNVKKGEKLAVIIDGDKIVVPVVNGNIPLIPEKSVPNGSKIS